MADALDGLPPLPPGFTLETIDRAALQDRAGRIQAGLPSDQHQDIIDRGGKGQPGFVTDRGRFVGREEGASLHEAATGQTVPRGQLHSEDLPAVQGGLPPLPPGFTLEGGPAPMTWKGALKSAVAHTPSSAVRFAKDVAQPFVHPVETYHGVKNIAKGVAEKLGASSGTEHKQYAEALAQFFRNRYGSVDAVKRTLATDPVGLMSDVAAVLSGGELALARAPSVIGTAGRVAGTVGRAVDPLATAGRTVGLGGKLASEVIGVTTGKGGEVIRQVAKAGYEGLGPVQRGRPEQLVEEFRKTLAPELKKERSAAYEAARDVWAASNQPLDFTRINQTVADTFGKKMFKGVSLSPSTQAIRQQLADTVADWQQLPRATYHTAEGLDALKQKLGDILASTEKGSPDHLVASNVYHAVRNEIVKQAPTYAKAMKADEAAQRDIARIEKALSKNQLTAEQALKRLQKVLGENAHLVTPGALEKLAGVALNKWAPRGLGALGIEVLGTLLGHGKGALAAMAALPFASPRIAGEAAYYTGKAAGGVEKLPLRPTVGGAYQLGRQEEP